MGIKKGTKLTNNPKNTTIKIRLDDSISKKLEEISGVKGITKSDVVRNGIEMQYQEIKNS